MIKIDRIEDNAAVTNNGITTKDMITEKKECVPYVWIYIVHEKIEKYIREKLTDVDGNINEEELEDPCYPFYVSITNENHVHLDTEGGSFSQKYEKTLYRNGKLERFTFKDENIGYYSIQTLRNFYFNKRNVTLRLKNRLVNEVSSKTSDSVKQFKSRREMKLLSNEESIIMKNMYVDAIFKLQYAGDKLPEWYYPMPNSKVEIEKAIDMAMRISESNKTVVSESKASKNKIKISSAFKSKMIKQ